MRPIPLFDTKRASVAPNPVHAFVIDIPPKIWRPKPKRSYVPVDLSTEFDDDIFVFPQYGTALRKPVPPTAPTRDDVHLFDPALGMDKFIAGFNIDCNIDPAIDATVRAIVQGNLDCFFEEGARQCIIGWEFSINTGAATPVCCPKPHYGPHESKIIMGHINSLLSNDWMGNAVDPGVPSSSWPPNPIRSTWMTLTILSGACVSLTVSLTG
jgi:hypothetical protein